MIGVSGCVDDLAFLQSTSTSNAAIHRAQAKSFRRATILVDASRCPRQREAISTFSNVIDWSHKIKPTTVVTRSQRSQPPALLIGPRSQTYPDVSPSNLRKQRSKFEVSAIHQLTMYEMESKKLPRFQCQMLPRSRRRRLSH